MILRISLFCERGGKSHIEVNAMRKISQTLLFRSFLPGPLIDPNIARCPGH